MTFAPPPSATLIPQSDVELDVGLDLTLALTAERGWPQQWRPAPRHSGIACAVIDAVMSPHVRSETVAAVVHRYQERHSAHDGPLELAQSFQEHGEQWSDVIGTRNRAWRSTQAPLKSTVIEAAAALLIREGVTTPEQLLSRVHDPLLRAGWLSLPGQSSGATWRHLLLVAGYEKPMVCSLTRQFIRRHVPFAADCLGDEEILEIMNEISRILSAPTQDIDHQMWRAGARAPQLG